MAAVIRAKIKLSNINRTGTEEQSNEQEYIAAHAVYDSNPDSENNQWSKWTPALSLNMTINNPSALGKLEQGKEYYLDFIPVEEGQQ